MVFVFGNYIVVFSITNFPARVWMRILDRSVLFYLPSSLVLFSLPLLFCLDGFGIKTGREKLNGRVLIWLWRSPKLMRESLKLERIGLRAQSWSQQLTCLSITVRTLAKKDELIAACVS